MRVLFVADALSAIGGGSQVAVLSWVKNLKKLGIDIKLLCNPAILTFEKDLKTEDLIINPAVPLGFFSPEFSLAIYIYSETRKQILSFNPDIIHLHEPSIISYKILEIAQSHNFLTIGSFHTNFKEMTVNKFPHSLIIRKGGLLNFLYDKIQFSILSKCTITTAPTQNFQEYLKTRLNNPVYLLPYPIDNSFFKMNQHPIPRPISKLITVSRLSGEKNIAILIKTMNYIKDTFTLTIVGEGGERKYLENQVKTLHLERFIKFTGWVKKEDLPSLLAQHDLYVSPSSFETFGISYMEALAAHAPCVLYDFSISREVIPSETSILIDSFDPRIWAQTLVYLQNNPQKYMSLRSTINLKYNEIEKYREDKATKKLIQLYQSILNHDTYRQTDDKQKVYLKKKAPSVKGEAERNKNI